MFTKEYTIVGEGQLRWKCYRRQHQTAQPCPDSVVLVGNEKKKCTLSHILMWLSVRAWKDRAYDCGCNSGSSVRDAIGSLRRTHPPLELYIT